VTRWTPPQIQELEAGLAEGRLHPRDVKMKLAHEVVSIYHSESAAAQAEQEFVRVFQQGNLPEEMPEYRLQPGQTVLDVLVVSGMVASKSEGRRMIEQHGVRLDGQVLDNASLPLPHTGVLQVGKRRYLRVL
jgi:tyrosyl-tRNA synthetase